MQWSESVVGGGNAAGKAIRAKAESCTPATMDNSLTNLNWLPDFRVPSIDGKEKSIDLLKQGSELTVSDSASSTGSTTLESEVERDECLLPLSPIKRCLNQTAEFEKNPLRFEEDPNKPPFSYTTIIYLAIRSCEKDKVMLSDIYQWIRDHFKYYRIAEPTWQVSEGFHVRPDTCTANTSLYSQDNPAVIFLPACIHFLYHLINFICKLYK